MPEGINGRTYLRMNYFLDPDFDPEVGRLCEEESRHAIKALRTAVGDEIEVGNGAGTRYTCQVVATGKQHLVVKVIHTAKVAPKEVHLTIALAPTKLPARFEWFLEKATELGMDAIVPLRTQRTEHPKVNGARMERIALAAAKQSQRAYLPQCHALTPFAEAICSRAELKLLAHCNAQRTRTALSEILHQNAARSVIILVGPEGDFTPEEISAAAQEGFVEVHLGENRLRTETAGVYCAALMSALLHP